MTKITETAAIEFARSLDYVSQAKGWNNSRVYLTIRGNGGNYRGEATSKTYIDLNTGKLVEQMGKGTTSNVWSDNCKALRAAFAASFGG